MATPRRDLAPRDPPPADISQQGGSGNGAKADLFAKLEKEGVEIDGRIASIIDDEIARIKAEAARKYVINGPIRNGFKGGSGNGAKADVARKTSKEVERLLAKLEKEGVEIDGKIASIVDDGIAGIKAEAAREKIDEPNEDRMLKLLSIASIAVGYFLGVEWNGYVWRKKAKNMAKSRHA